MIDQSNLKHVEDLRGLPPAYSQNLMPSIQEKIASAGDKVVVLDDDPTGTQTVHNVRVLTFWDIPTLAEALSDPSPAVFILTNTRSLFPQRAIALNREIVSNMQLASKEVGRGFVLISRSDSTLRGYFPLETDTIAQSMSINYDSVLLIPAFMAGGRYTINSVHYVVEDDALVPVGETAFAKDAAFGYASSDLRDWVAEKTKGRVSATQVKAIPLETVRQGPEQVAEILLSLTDAAYCVIDAVTERDLEVAALAAMMAEAQGQHFLYRTAASFAAIRAGIDLRPLLTAEELRIKRTGGGLVIVGSYVPKSSIQLDYLLTHTTIERIEVQVERLLNDVTQADEIERVVTTARPMLNEEQTVVIYTSRQLVQGDNAETSLNIGNRISTSLVAITTQLKDVARFIVAKGGITSSDIATKALQVKQATVKGQIIPGVPVWELGDKSDVPHLVYVVFPGNVGSTEAIVEVVQKLDNQLS